MKTIDDRLLSFLKSILSNKEKLLKSIKRNRDLFAEDPGGLIRIREELLIRMDKVQEAMKKQQLAYEQDVIILDEYKERMLELREEKKVLQRRIDELNMKLERVDSAECRINELYSLINKYIEDIGNLPLEEKFNLVGHFEEIYIDENGEITDFNFKL